MTRRSTRTITVLSDLSLTTVPCMTRLGMATLRPVAPPARQDGLDAGNVAAHLAHPRRVLELSGGLLETQVELLLLQLQQLLAQLVFGLARRSPAFITPAPPAARRSAYAGQLGAAAPIASSARAAGTPSISNMIDRP